MQFDFPPSPNIGDVYEANNVKYVWSGKVWNVVIDDPMQDIEFMLDRKVNRDGDTMLDSLYLPPGNPVHGYEATHKNYVDTKVTEAPDDGKAYARQSKDWTETTAFIDADSDGNSYGRKDGTWVEVAGEVAAPRESTELAYLRTDGAWVEGIRKEDFDASQLDQDILIDRKIFRGGDEMTGPLHLPPGNPTHGYEAVHKNYVDQNTVIQEPKDGKIYGRQDGEWAETVTRDEALDLAIQVDRKVNVGGDTMKDSLYLPPANPTTGYEACHKNYVDTKLGEAPTDGMAYVRINAGWEAIPEEIADVPIVLERKVSIDGDVMTGMLMLPGQASDPHHAVTLGDVENWFVKEAPDSKLYARKGSNTTYPQGQYAREGEWVETSVFLDAPVDGIVYGRKDSNWVESVEEAPREPDNPYLRRDGNWVVGVTKEDIDAGISNLEHQFRNKVDKSGDSMLGPLTLEYDPSSTRHAVHKAYVDQRFAVIYTDVEPPPDANKNALWWDEDTGGLYLNYDDGDTTQWVQTNGLGGAVSGLLDSVPINGQSYGLTDRQWREVHTAYHGDIKSGFQASDHGGWVKLDGRAITTLKPAQKIAAEALGFTTNLPNATGSVVMQTGTAVGTIGGTMNRAVKVTQAMLPNVTLTAASSGAHTHVTDSQGNHKHDLYRGHKNNAGNIGFENIDEAGTSPTGGVRWANTAGTCAPHDANDYHGTVTKGMQTTGAHTHTAQSAGAHTHSVALGGTGADLAFNVAPQALSANSFVYLGNL